MSSTLAQQLQLHRQENPLPPPADAKKSRPSILFRGEQGKKANQLDAKALLDLGRNGLQQLCVQEPSLKKYLATLFSPVLGSDPRSERHLLPKEERESVDEQCRELLGDIAPYLGEESGKQVLEFLLQRYMVHISSTDALMSAAVRYHETPFFAAVTQLPSLPLSNSKWEYFGRIKLNENGISRTQLVTLCTKDFGLFEEICKSCSIRSPRLFAAVVLEGLEKMNKDGAAFPRVESFVQIAIRNSLDCFKCASLDNVLAACSVFSATTRLLALSVDAAEAIAIVISKRLAYAVSKNAEESGDLARCLIQVYEWQNKSDVIGSSRGSLFEESDRWAKFLKHAVTCLQMISESEGDHASSLLTDILIRGLQSGSDEITNKIDSVVKPGNAFAVRAHTVCVCILDMARAVKAQKSASFKLLRSSIEIIAQTHPEVLTACLFALNANDRAQIAKALFPEPNSNLAIQFVPAENDLNLPLGLRDPRVAVRLMVLQHLKAHPKKISTVLFSVEDEDMIAALLLDNYRASESSKSEDANEEVALIFELWSLIDNCDDRISEVVVSFAKDVVLSLSEGCYPERIVSAAVGVLSHSGKEQDLLALARILSSESASASFRAQAKKALSKSWLDGLSEDAELSGPVIAKKLKKEKGELLYSKILSLAESAPNTALVVCVELGEGIKASWILDILERISERDTDLRISRYAKHLVPRMVTELGVDNLLKRAFEVQVHVWPRLIEIVAGALQSLRPSEAHSALWRLSSVSDSEDDKNDRRLVRALRLLKLSFESMHGHTSKPSQPTSALSSKDGKKRSLSVSSSSNESSEWVPLIACLKYPRSKLVRSAALSVLEYIPGHASDLLLSRRNEIERDPFAVDRAFSQDVQVRTVLGRQAVDAVTEGGDLVMARAAIECCREPAMALAVLATLLDRGNTKRAGNREHEKQLVKAAFDCLLEASEPPMKEKAMIRTVCQKGIEEFPIWTLKWMERFPNVVPAAKDMLERLIDAAVGRIAPQNDSQDIVAEIVERCGKVLNLLRFDEKLVLDELKLALGAVTSNKSSSKTELTEEEKVRRLCVMVDLLGSPNSTTYSWKAANALFEVAKCASEKQLSLLEQSVLASLERVASLIASDKSKMLKEEDAVNAEALSESLLKVALQASNPAAKMAALRAFEKSHPSNTAFERAFKDIDDAKSLEKLADALTSQRGPMSIEKDSSLIVVFGEAVRRLEPHNQVMLLKAVAGRCENPADVVSQWMRLSGSETDCSAIAGQFDARIQTDLLIQLVNEGEFGGLAFVGRHISSRTYLKALVEKQDTDISQFIELFESLLRRLVEWEVQTKENKASWGHVNSALEALSVLLTIPVFIPVITETLMREEFNIRLLALKILKTKLHDESKDWSKEETKVVLEFTQTIIDWLGVADFPAHTSILALNTLALHLAPDHKDLFVKAIPLLTKILENKFEDFTTAGAACLCIGTLCKAVTMHSLPHLPTLVPALLKAAKQQDEPVLRQAAIAALKDVVESKVTLGSLLDTVVELAITSQQECEEILDALGQTVEPRLGYATCLKALKGGKNSTTTMQLLDAFIARTTSSDAVVHLRDLKELCVESLVRSQNTRTFDASAIVRIGLLLSEKRLKEVVDDLIQVVEEGDASKASMMEVLRAFLEKFGSLFLSILPFDWVLETLKDTVAAMKEQNIAKESSKKHKTGMEASVALEYSLRCLAECLIHAMNSGFMDPTRFEQVLPHLVGSLQVVSPEFSFQFVEPCLATLALSSLSSSQANAMLQMLHHAVTKLLRSPSSRVRHTALSCVKVLFERVGNDYLVLMPDTLPFLAELLEDSDEDVRLLAQKLALVLRDLSGEDIAEFLR